MIMMPVLGAPQAFAQEDEALEEVTVTGVRGKPRTVQDSPVAVDVFSTEDLENVEFSDMNDIIRLSCHHLICLEKLSPMEALLSDRRLLEDCPRTKRLSY